MHTTQSLEIFNDEWCQLYDSKSKRFYYYNLNNDKTTWIKPDNFDVFDSSNKINHNALLSNIIKSIMSSQIFSNTNFIDDLIDKINSQDFLCNINQTNEREEDDLDSTIFYLINKIKNKLIEMNDVNNSAFLMYNSSNVMEKSIGRRIQPRTNPNYSNIDTICDYRSQRKSKLIKTNNNTLLSSHKINNNKNDLNVSKHNLNSLRNISKSFVIFLRILKKTNMKHGTISKVYQNKNKTFQVKSIQNQNNMLSSLSNILKFSGQSKIDSLSFNNISNFNTTSLTNKNKEKILTSRPRFNFCIFLYS
jgi:hypothetical protein